MSQVPAHIVVAGKVNDPEFQIARNTAEALAAEHSNVTCEILSMLEFDWEKYAREMSAKFGVDHRISPLAFYNGQHYIGMSEELLIWAAQVYKYRVIPNSVVHNQIAKKELRKHMLRTKRKYAFFDIKVGSRPSDAPQRVVFELFTDVCPRTCDNFLRLCTGEDSKHSYVGSAFHRVVAGGWVQGGDVIDGSGANSESADGGVFQDECFSVDHNDEGLLAMANEGSPHTNGSQFFVTLGQLDWLNLSRVVFGRVVMGMRAFRVMEKQPLKHERPITPCVVAQCGEFTGFMRRKESDPGGVDSSVESKESMAMTRVASEAKIHY